MLRTFVYCSMDLCGPHLEYCLSVWSLYLRKDVYCLEKVQLLPGKLVRGLEDKSYEERMRLLGITSLEESKN